MASSDDGLEQRLLILSEVDGTLCWFSCSRPGRIVAQRLVADADGAGERAEVGPRALAMFLQTVDDAARKAGCLRRARELLPLVKRTRSSPNVALPVLFFLIRPPM